MGLWYSQSKEFGERNIYYDTYRTWLRLMKGQDQKMKQLPEILAASMECRKVHIARKKAGGLSKQTLEALQEKFQSIVTRPVLDDAATLKGNILLHAHLQRRTQDLSSELKTDLDAMLSKAPELLAGMIDMAWQQRFLGSFVRSCMVCACLIFFTILFRFQPPPPPPTLHTSTNFSYTRFCPFVLFLPLPASQTLP